VKLDVETARELAYGRPGEVIDGFEVMVNEMVDTSRWSINHRLVVLDRESSSYWETYYSVGATEMQDERPFEWEGEVEFDEVEPVEVIRVEYRRV